MIPSIFVSNISHVKKDIFLGRNRFFFRASFLLHLISSLETDVGGREGGGGGGGRRGGGGGRELFSLSPPLLFYGELQVVLAHQKKVGRFGSGKDIFQMIRFVFLFLFHRGR